MRRHSRRPRAGPGSRDAVVAEVAQAAAEIGIEPGTPFAAELAGRLDDVGLARNGRPEPEPPPKRSRLARVPVWVWLAGLVVLSAVFRYGLSRRVVAPWIMVDELIYSELAKSFAQSGHFLIRDVHAGAYGVVYPLLIAPAWRVFGSVPDAYAAAKTIGSVLMSLDRDSGVLPRASGPDADSLAASPLCSPSPCRR